MTGRKISGENREWWKARRKIRKAQEDEYFLIGISNDTDLKILTYRSVKYSVDQKVGTRTVLQ